MRGAFGAYIVVGLALIGISTVLWRAYLRPLTREADRLPRSVDRHSLRLGIASISANVLALLLIALVGLANLGFEIWKFDSARQSREPATLLEALLQKGLPDTETLQRQHQDLVAAIRSLTPPPSVPVPVNDAAIPAAFSKLQTRIEKLEGATEQGFSGMAVLGYVVGLLLICAFLGGAVLLVRAFFAERNARKKWIEGVGGVALLLASTVGGAKLKADFKPNLSLAKDLHVDAGAFSFKLLDLKNINFDLFGHGGSKPTPSPEPQRDIDVYLHLDVGQPGEAIPAKMDCGPKNDRRVGPFDDGAVTLNSDDGRNSLDGIIKDLKQQLVPTSANVKPDRLTAIILVGSADKRSLKPRTVALYNSNAGLAQARIAVVKEALGKVFASNKPPIIESYAGPVQTSATVPVASLAGDRSVQVCILWDRKS